MESTLPKQNHQHCCVPFCTNDGRQIHHGISFHRLPKDSKRRKAWLLRIRRKEGPENTFIVTDDTYICSAHFQKEDYRWTAVRKCLKRDAIPSVFNWHCSKPRRKSRKKFIDDIPSMEDEGDGNRVDNVDNTPAHQLGAECQTEAPSSIKAKETEAHNTSGETSGHLELEDGTLTLKPMLTSHRPKSAIDPGLKSPGTKTQSLDSSPGILNGCLTEMSSKQLGDLPNPNPSPMGMMPQDLLGGHRSDELPVGHDGTLPKRGYRKSSKVSETAQKKKLHPHSRKKAKNNRRKDLGAPSTHADAETEAVDEKPDVGAMTTDQDDDPAVGQSDQHTGPADGLHNGCDESELDDIKPDIRQLQAALLNTVSSSMEDHFRNDVAGNRFGFLTHSSGNAAEAVVEWTVTATPEIEDIKPDHSTCSNLLLHDDKDSKAILGFLTRNSVNAAEAVEESTVTATPEIEDIKPDHSNLPLHDDEDSKTILCFLTPNSVNVAEAVEEAAVAATPEIEDIKPDHSNLPLCDDEDSKAILDGQGRQDMEAEERCMSSEQESHGDKDNKTQCPMCTKYFSRRSYMLKYHTTVCEARRKRKKKRREEAICQLCGKSFSNIYYLRTIHMKVHSGELPFQCDLCGKGFIAKTCLNSHMKRYHAPDESKTFVCTVCSKAFVYQSELQVHVRVHTRETPFPCHVCHKTFSLMSHVQVHMRTHTGVKPYVCKVSECGKRFAYLSSLRSHWRTHTGERPYECPTCSKTFGYHNSFKNHLRTHTGEKPHVCRKCGACFTQSAGLRAHSRKFGGDISQV